MKHTPKVTIVIPTYNRSALLRSSITSVLNQDYSNFQLLVLDNGSSDDTKETVHSFKDSRLTYERNNTNIGIFRNWRRALELNSSPYLHLLQDDDVMLEGFLRESALALDKHPQASFSFTLARRIDIHGNKGILIDGHNLPPAGVMSGIDYLQRVVEGHPWAIHTSTVMMRSSAIAEVGPFENTHAVYSMGTNLFFRLASHFDIIFINKELIHVRWHEGQITQADFAGNGPLGQLPLMAERMDTVAYLLQSDRAVDKSYRRWLSERILFMSMLRSELTQQLIPDLNLPWSTRLEIAQQEMSTLIPRHERFILVDGGQWDATMACGRTAFPFMERNNQYWGPPSDDQAAIVEFERLHQRGASFIVFGWPAFWWFDYYVGFRDYLESKCHCILKNSRLIVFHLPKD